MKDEPRKPLEVLGDEALEARIVAWILGEASAFEAAEIEARCKAAPELQSFADRMREIHGLIVADGKAISDEDWRLPEEKRRKVVDLLGIEEKPVTKIERRWRVPRRAILSLAACVLATLIALPMVLRMDSKYSPSETIALHSFSASKEGLDSMDPITAPRRHLREFSRFSEPQSAPTPVREESVSLTAVPLEPRLSAKPSPESDLLTSNLSDGVNLQATGRGPDSNDDLALVDGDVPSVFLGFAGDEPSDGWGVDDLAIAGEGASDDPFAASSSSPAELNGAFPDPSVAAMIGGADATWGRSYPVPEVAEHTVGESVHGLNRDFMLPSPAQEPLDEFLVSSPDDEGTTKPLKHKTKLNAPMDESGAIDDGGSISVAGQNDPFGNVADSEEEQLAKNELPQLDQVPSLGMLFKASEGAVGESKNSPGSGISEDNSINFSAPSGDIALERYAGVSDAYGRSLASASDVVEETVTRSGLHGGRMKWFGETDDFDDGLPQSEERGRGQEDVGSFAKIRGVEVLDFQSQSDRSETSFAYGLSDVDGLARLGQATGVAGKLTGSAFAGGGSSSDLETLDLDADEGAFSGGGSSNNYFFSGGVIEGGSGLIAGGSSADLGGADAGNPVNGRRGLSLGNGTFNAEGMEFDVAEGEMNGVPKDGGVRGYMSSNGGVLGNFDDEAKSSSVGLGELANAVESKPEQLGRDAGFKSYLAFGDLEQAKGLERVEAIDEKAAAGEQHWDFNQANELNWSGSSGPENEIAKLDGRGRKSEAAPIRLREVHEIDSVSFAVDSDSLEEAQQRLNQLKDPVDGESPVTRARVAITPDQNMDLAANISHLEKERAGIALHDGDDDARGGALQLGSEVVPEPMTESVRWGTFFAARPKSDEARGEAGKSEAKLVAEKMQKRLSDAPLVVLEANKVRSPKALSFDRRWESTTTLQVRPELVDAKKSDGIGNRDLTTVPREDSLKGLSDNLYSEDLIREVVDELELPSKTGRGEDALVREIKKGIKLLPIEGTDLVEFRFKNSDKGIAGDVSAKLVEGARILESEKRARRSRMAHAELSEAILPEEENQEQELGMASQLNRSQGLSYRAAVVRASSSSTEADEGRENWSESQLQEMLETQARLKKSLETMAEVSAAEEPYSTFSLHVSDASFKLAAAAVERGEIPPAEGIRPEEFYNSFDYGDPAPSAGEPVACSVEQCAHPAFPSRNLLRIAVRTGSEGRAQSTPLNLTLLMDNSGSMEREDRSKGLSNAVEGLSSLLKEGDTVTVAGFSRTPRLLADRIDGKDAAMLNGVVDEVPAEGGTNLEEALKLGGELAKRQWREGAQNRVVLFTDGAANLGDADPDSLNGRVEKLRQEGISFDAAGFGAEGLNDRLLERLTRNGNGRYYVVDKPEDADDRFARQLAGAFRPAAENVKVQVVFNPDRVGSYKLIGFEEHRLKKEDFKNDKVDAAEMASEEAGNALYQFEVLPEGRGEVGRVSVRFRDTSSGEMVERSWAIPYEEQVEAFDQAKPGIQLAGLSAFVAEKMRNAPMAAAVDIGELAPLIETLPSQYADNPRIKQLRRMIDRLR